MNSILRSCIDLDEQHSSIGRDPLKSRHQFDVAVPQCEFASAHVTAGF
jgi:hypothetical protein